MNSWQFMGPAALASLVMAPLHCLFGLHIVRRGVIFIDLAIAQVAALGTAVAIARGNEPESDAAFRISLAFALSAALLFALTRFRHPRVPQEAIIGIVYIVATAASIIVLELTPHGSEELKNLLAGSILVADTSQVATIGYWYIGIFVVLVALWRSTTRISYEEAGAPGGWSAVAYDFLFYALVGVTVTWSVRLAGVLVVFTWLVMPAVCAFLWAGRMGAAIAVALPVALLGSFAGLYVSQRFDWPTGAAIVVAFGAIVTALYAARCVFREAPG